MMEEYKKLNPASKDTIAGEALPPAYDPGYRPVKKLTVPSMLPDDQNIFVKWKKSDDGDDTDGQYDSDIDSDGLNMPKKSKCKHRSILDYKCVNCPYLMTKFANYFDSGIIPRYLRILQITDSADCSKHLQDADIIYECYKPTNIIQVRDYMQTVLSRSILT